MQPFLAVIWLRPTDRQQRDGEEAKILVEPFAVMAENSSKAVLMASRRIPTDAPANRVEVAVLPFAR